MASAKVPVSEIESAIEESISAYRKAAETGDTAAMARAGTQRRLKLLSLVKGIHLDRSASYSAKEYGALAMAYEYLSQRENCIFAARKSIDADPTCQLGYPPLFRTLLNGKEYTEAEKYLETGKQALPEMVSIQTSSLLFYRHYRSVQAWEDAARHITSVVDFLVSRTKENPRLARVASKYFPELSNAVELAESEGQQKKRITALEAEIFKYVEQDIFPVTFDTRMAVCDLITHLRIAFKYDENSIDDIIQNWLLLFSEEAISGSLRLSQFELEIHRISHVVNLLEESHRLPEQSIPALEAVKDVLENLENANASQVTKCVTKLETLISKLKMDSAK